MAPRSALAQVTRLTDIEPLDEIAYRKSETDILVSLEKAFSHRPDYEAAKIDLKNKDINVVYYKNGMLPIVDLVGSYGFNGLAKNFEKDMGVLGSGMYEDWTIGVSVKVPLGNDGDFTFESLFGRFNAELASDLVYALLNHSASDN